MKKPEDDSLDPTQPFEIDRDDDELGLEISSDGIHRDSDPIQEALRSMTQHDLDILLGGRSRPIVEDKVLQ